MNNVLVKSIMTLSLLGFINSGYSQENPQREVPTINDPRDIFNACVRDNLDKKQALERLDWADKNHVIPLDIIEDYRYRVSPKGTVIKRARPYYPIFGIWDRENGNLESWKPEDCSFPSQLPLEIKWLAGCVSKR